MTPIGVRSFDYYIGTEKLGEIALLRMDEVSEVGSREDECVSWADGERSGCPSSLP
jgi:hypothetical protein